MSQGIPLADAIRALRSELIAAVQEDQSEEIRFALGPTEIEMEVEITTEAGGFGRIRYWAVSGDEEGVRASRVTHKVRVNLTPVLASGTPGAVPLVVESDQVGRPR
jgi:hypothetical protein